MPTSLNNKILAKVQVVELRKKGLSYGEIKKIIAVSKSTISFWLKDVPLTTEQRERLYTKKLLAIAGGHKSYREKRRKVVQAIIDQRSKGADFARSIQVVRRSSLLVGRE